MAIMALNIEYRVIDPNENQAIYTSFEAARDDIMNSGHPVDRIEAYATYSDFDPIKVGGWQPKDFSGSHMPQLLPLWETHIRQHITLLPYHENNKTVWRLIMPGVPFAG